MNLLASTSNNSQQLMESRINDLYRAAEFGVGRRLDGIRWGSLGGPGTANARKWENELRDRVRIEELAKRAGQIETLRRKQARMKGELAIPSPAPVIVIIPCGKSKVFGRPNMISKLPQGLFGHAKDNTPIAQAQAAYCSRLFKLSLAFAHHFGDTFRILSANVGNGLLEGHDFIENYDASFLKKTDETVSLDFLREQARQIDWTGYSQIMVLGGVAYRSKVTEFMPESARERLFFPFAGLDLPKLHSALTRAVEWGNIDNVREVYGLTG